MESVDRIYSAKSFCKGTSGAYNFGPLLLVLGSFSVVASVSTILLLVLCLPASGAVPTKPEYPSIADDAPFATVESQAVVNLTGGRCQIPLGQRICMVRLGEVDGQPTSLRARSIRVEPGTRRLGLICSYAKGGPMFFGTMQFSGRDIDVSLEAGRVYRVVARRTDSGCRPELIDTVSNDSIGTDAVVEEPAQPVEAGVLDHQ